MKIIKDKKLITVAYCTKLAEYIKANQETFFAKDNEADSWFDFTLWPESKTDRNHLIMPGEICIVDREWEGVHAYTICQFYGKRKARDLWFVVAVDSLNINLWRNGYFLIPDLTHT